MNRTARRALFPLLVLAAIGCRGVLGINEDRDLVSPDAGEADAGAREDAAEAAGGPGYCERLEPKPFFCSDFDQGDVTKGWENEGKIPNPGEFGGGKIELDSRIALSRPASAAFSLPALVRSSDKNAAFLLNKLLKVPDAVRVDFDAFIATEDLPKGTAGNVTIALLRFVGTASVELTRDSVGTALAVYLGASGSTRSAVVSLSERFPVGVWKHVTIFVQSDRDAGADPENGYTRVDIDSIEAAAATIPTAYRSGATSLNIDLGAFGQGPTGPFRANIDNVRIYTVDKL